MIPEALLSLIAIPILLITTYLGLGLEGDSAYYIAGARNLAHGLGFTVTTSTGLNYINWFPPLYPFVLSWARFLHLDPLIFGRYLQIGLFFCGSVLIGNFIRRATHSYSAAVFGILLFLFSRDILNVYSMAWSEGLFVLILLFFLMFLARFLENGNRYSLVSAAAFTGLAILTRYAGAALLLAGLLTLLLQPKEWIAKLKSLSLYSAVSALLPGLLFFWNRAHAGAATNRSFALHLKILPDQISSLRFALSYWLNATSESKPIVLGCVLLFIFSVSWPWWLLYRRRRLHPLVQTAAAFLAVYIPFLAFVNFSLDADMIPSSDRILSPFHVCLIITFLSTLFSFFKNKPKEELFSALFMIVTVPYVLSGMNYIIDLKTDGYVFSSPIWHSSQTLAMLRSQFSGWNIYTNLDYPVLLYLDNPCSGLPEKYDAVARELLSTFDEDMKDVTEQLKRPHTLLVFFDNDTDPVENGIPTATDISRFVKLHLVAKLRDGTIFRASEQL